MEIHLFMWLNGVSNSHFNRLIKGVNLKRNVSPNRFKEQLKATTQINLDYIILWKM